MLIVTAGGWESHCSPRGVNGPIDDLLFPIQHGILYYPGFDVLPPFVVYRTGKMDEVRFAAIREALGRRLDSLSTTRRYRFANRMAAPRIFPSSHCDRTSRRNNRASRSTSAEDRFIGQSRICR